ncbi:MAG: hypothetical protein KC483_02510 [Nitrosarchaeum sp.]|nr:hypothetical protein [Nitrosarchaeum sp.]
MLTKSFGAPFTFDYYPQVDGEAINPPAQTPTIYIFDTKPTNDQAQNNTGSLAIETITSWTEATDNYRPFSVSAIDDPDDGTKSKVYYAAINYVAVTGGSATLDIEEFKLVRPEGHTEAAAPTVADLKEYDSNLATYWPTDSVIQDYIDKAELKVKRKLEGKKIKWQLIENPGVLTESIAYKALADMWHRKKFEDGDRFDSWRLEYLESFNDSFASLVFEYDSNENDTIEPEEEEESNSTFVFNR